MSEEDSPDLTKSWVFVDSEKKSSEDQTSGIEEVSENENSEPHPDSDTDSISVISESGCSYKTDEEEFAPATTTPSEEEIHEEELPKITEVAPPDSVEVPKPSPENEAVEKLLYFATSAVCALILIGFSILVQHYFYTPSDVNKFVADFEQPLPHHHVQSVKDVQVDNVLKKSYNFKRKNSQEIEMKMSKKQKVDVEFHDRITSPASAQIENNDLTTTVEAGDVKSNYKLSKNKSPATKFNKENCDDSERQTKNEESYKKFRKYEKSITNENNPGKDETLNKKMKELKMKEAYLKEKEKFLMEKEQDLMKKERKLNKERNKNEKKPKIDKGNEGSSEEYDSKEKIKKYNKQQKKYNNDQKMNKKHKNKEEKKRYSDQNHKVIDENQHKKRNISGQWYIDLHKARNNIRRKEHASDWVFDRAHLRSLKRNKAHWYFQWMVDRAKLRVK